MILILLLLIIFISLLMITNGKKQSVLSMEKERATLRAEELRKEKAQKEADTLLEKAQEVISNSQIESSNILSKAREKARESNISSSINKAWTCLYNLEYRFFWRRCL
ncbi:MAG: hypothetical protein RR904_04825 [Bacilli bacterium]